MCRLKSGQNQSPLILSETYMHFDTLIWQMPSVGMAVGVGAIIAASQIQTAEGWTLNLQQIRGLILTMGAVLLVALAAALFKYRIFSTAATPSPLPKPPFGESPSAGSWLQLSMTITTGLLAGFAAAQFVQDARLIVLGGEIGVIAWIGIEDRLSKIKSQLRC